MFSDITATARTTSVWLYVYLAAVIVGLLANAYAVFDPAIIRTGDEFGPVDVIDVSSLVVFIVAGWLTLRWIYRANANAQQLADDMSVSPRGNVIWFFVPIGNLWVPFAGVRETWQVSHAPNEWRSVRVPLLLRMWWASWLAESLLGNVSARQAFRAEIVDEMVAVHAIEIGVCGFTIVTTLLLIRIIRRLSDAQAHTIARHVFA